MTTLQANESQQLQLDDAHRALLTALCSLRFVAGDCTNGVLLSEVQRLHACLASAADELAQLRMQARLNDSCLNAAG